MRDEAMHRLEAADELISLDRAAALLDLTADNLRQSALSKRLVASKIAGRWVTTRRDLHLYALSRRRGVVKPLPVDYVAPDGPRVPRHVRAWEQP